MIAKRKLHENWTAYVIGRMHRYSITNSELAAECDYTPQYLSTVLNGKKRFKTEDAKEQTKTKIFYALKTLEESILRGER